MTLVSPGAGRANQIIACIAYAAGATSADVEGQKNDGSVSLFRVGGVGTTALAAHYLEGVIGYPGDASKITLSAAAASASELTVVYKQVPA